ncbi:MAG: hypothetical protein UY48_C0007G0016 [Candidatus Gottesmanbacteria bacterium GW2011_GWB1_49_7]|uniref:Uncharacterized protein n=1 Tax=Candidatus Gottesmanbacteria bacterium GW2011_GWB1_49_7 TaxID=1618448 RepID=A0A0G1YD69_9BACT|nr:MAG: hypothetical protein UY48_C0007G0016 [Candidatus Gottesmanbacteria bacterium GW2011_GWB1_49_7]
MVEQCLHKACVAGPIPAAGTICYTTAMSDINRAAEQNLNPHLPEWYLLKLKEILYSESNKRNFQILLFQSEQRLDIVLQKPDRSHTYLQSFLPEGNTFALGDENQYHLRSRTVELNPKDFKYKGSVLRILHEIGHARTHSPHPIAELSFLKKTLLILEGIPRFIKAQRALQREPMRGNIWFDAIFPKEYAEKVLTYKAKMERNAWTEALKMAQELEKKGFNVLGEFNNLGEIQEFTAFSLTSYEFAMKHGQRLVGDPITPGKFTKRAP